MMSAHPTQLNIIESAKSIKITTYELHGKSHNFQRYVLHKRSFHCKKIFFSFISSYNYNRKWVLKPFPILFFQVIKF